MAAETIKGINVVLGADTTALSKALSDVNKESRNIQSELKQVEKLLKLDPGNTELLAQKQKLLGEAIETTSKKLEQLKDVQDQVRQQFEKGEISKGQFRAFQREIEGTEQQLKSLQEELKKTGAVAVAEMGEKLEKAGDKMQSVGKTMTTAVTAPVLGIATAVAKVGMDYEAQMSKVQAISGSTAEQMAALSDKAKEIGASTKLSATQVAEGYEYMSLAGWDAEQQLDAINDLVALSIAGDLELASASDILTDSMSAFSLEAKDAGKVANAFAYAQNNANTNVSQVGEAMKYTSLSAANMGLSIEQTTAYLGKMADVGLKGSQGGTALNAMLRDLKKSADEGAVSINGMTIALADEAGNYRNMTDVLADMETALAGTTDAQRDQALMSVFQDQSLRAVNALLNAGSDELRNFTEEMSGLNGYVQETAEVMGDNLQGRITTLQSSLEGLALQLFDLLLPAFESLVAAVQGIVDRLANLDESTKENIIRFAGFLAAVGPVLSMVGKLTSGIGGLVTKFAPLIAKLGTATGSFGTIGAAISGVATGPLVVIVAAVAAFIAILADLWQNNEEFRDKVTKLWDALTKALTALWDKFGKGLLSIAKTAYGLIEAALKTFVGVLEGIIKTFTGVLTGDWKTAWEGLSGIITSIKDGTEAALRSVITGLMDIVTNWVSSFVEVGANIVRGLWEGISGLWGWLTGNLNSASSNLATGVEDTLNIQSPSKVFADIGKNITLGMAKGIEDGASATRRAMNEVTHGLVRQNYGATGGGDTHVSAAGMFAGATITVRNDEDIRKLAQEVSRALNQSTTDSTRSAGVARV